jgi:hypothetical protein
MGKFLINSGTISISRMTLTMFWSFQRTEFNKLHLEWQPRSRGLREPTSQGPTQSVIRVLIPWLWKFRIRYTGASLQNGTERLIQRVSSKVHEGLLLTGVLEYMQSLKLWKYLALNYLILDTPEVTNVTPEQCSQLTWNKKQSCVTVTLRGR